jgi:archaeal chaperonin
MSQNPENKQTAQKLNIRAAKAIADTVKTTLGPAGMDKMMVDAGGNAIATNDGATILQELDVAHPGAKMIIEAANTQESMCYDGTTSTVVLAGALLGNSEPLFDKGLHPNVICKGYREATKWAVDHIDTLGSSSEDHLHNVARTSITGKAVNELMSNAPALCVEAAQLAGGDFDRIRVLTQLGGSADDSSCFSGVVLHKEFMLPAMPTEPNNMALLINSGLSDNKVDDNVQLSLGSAAEYQNYKQFASRDHWVTKAQCIIDLLPDGGTVFVRDHINEVVAATLAKENISAVQRLQESDMTALAKLMNIPIAHTVEELTNVAECNVKCETIGDMKYVVVKGDGEVTTLILRGATKQTLDETERGFDDALGVVCLAYNTGKVVPGGGSAYLNAALHLRTRAAEIGGRAQMAIDAFAEALETIPGTIAENAGHSSLDTVLALRNDHLNGLVDYGPDVENGGTTSMIQADVWEPLGLVRQAIQSASEVTISILRIDDIIGKRGE